MMTTQKISPALPPKYRRQSTGLFRAFTGLLAVTLGIHAGQAASTDIRPEPGGKRLLVVDENVIRPEPGFKKLLVIDDHDIRPGAGGKSLLYMDDNDVRDKFGGIRIAIWDDNTLRRSPGGKALLYIDGNDIRNEAGGKRLYFIDGPKLSLPQLTAVIYQLKPELLTLSNEEKTRLEKEFAAAGAEADAEAKADHMPGKYDILGYHCSDGSTQSGTVTVTKQGDYYAVSYDAKETPGWKGIATKRKIQDGSEELWAAVGPEGAVSLGVYEAANGKLTGTWMPINAGDNPAVLGHEVLVGPAGGGGTYKIESGQLPNGGAKYTGALNIKPMELVLRQDAKTYQFQWPSGLVAAAFSLDDNYGVCAGWGADYRLIRVRYYVGNLTGEFIGKNNNGSFFLSK